ncbi:cytoplasmic dynein 2 heavy chain 1 [Pelomyxa schiedti]|nr:cytoplasmic dynein 2 heavy chain 1 [Pelomyxa schiedti]
MYRFSLGCFLPLFRRALASASGNPSDTRNHIDLVVSSLEKIVFEYVCRSLFKADRLVFAMHLVHATKSHFFQPKEWEYFIGQISETSSRSDSFPSWAPKDRRNAFTELEALFPRVTQSLQLSQTEVWASWAVSSTCEVDWPPRIKSKSTAFQRLLLIKALRPDRLESAMSSFCSEALGLSTLQPSALNLQRVFRDGETEATTPILLITTPGADPSHDVEVLAEEILGSDSAHADTPTLLALAVGQVQQEQILEALHTARTRGSWLLLKNVHLAVAWLHSIDAILAEASLPHENFRLWLTSESHEKISPILLQSSLKITYESPPGKPSYYIIIF